MTAAASGGRPCDFPQGHDLSTYDLAVGGLRQAYAQIDWRDASSLPDLVARMFWTAVSGSAATLRHLAAEIAEAILNPFKARDIAAFICSQ